MRFIGFSPGRRHQDGWPYSCWLLSCLIVLAWSQFSYAAQWLGERSFRELSPPEISSLVSTPDPAANLDPKDPKSHLSRILIPRPRK